MIVLSVALAVAAGASTPDPVSRVREAVMDSARLEADLRALCDGIGPRMTGTGPMRRALEWGLQAFSVAGLSNVRLEAVPIPLRWKEGDTRIEVIEPVEFSLRAASSALSPAVARAIEVDLVDGGSGEPGGISTGAASFRGKVALVQLDQVGSFDDIAKEQRDAMVAMGEAEEVGALAVLFLSTRPHRLLYRHINNVAGRLDRIPSALVAREDGLRLLRLLRGGERVRVGLRMPNRIGGPYETANVVAEIPGGDLADEIVLVGAHLDSWDMGTGCLDNAANVALVIHLARSVRAAGVVPRRTLRFVLFGGEELGLFGSRSYVERHRSELDRHVAAIVHDMGAGPLLGYSVGGREQLLPKLEEILPSPGPGQEYRHTREAFFLSDNFTFVLHGVPSLFAVQDTSAFYLTYHSEADTLDKIEQSHVTDAAVAAASVTIGIANRQSRFAERLSERQVLEWLRQTGLVRHLRFLGVWESWRPSDAGSAGR